jgi:CubicO group peptidase (beta-lactamase class C family)
MWQSAVRHIAVGLFFYTGVNGLPLAAYANCVPDPSARAVDNHAAAAWPRHEPSALRLDAQKISALDQILPAQYPRLRSLLIVRDKQLAYAYYRADLNEGSLHNVRSVTKSVLSSLVGVALKDKLWPHLQVPLAELISSWPKDQPSSAVTLAQLLSFTAGFDPATSGGTIAELLTGPTLERARGRSLVVAPGAQFFYSNMDSHLVSVALTQRTGKNAAAFAQDTLFAALGIQSFEWPQDREGHSMGASHLEMRSSDMAKLGQLWLQQGCWGGQQLLDSAYVKAAVQPQNAGGPPSNRPYGYLWWISKVPGTEVPSFYANGFGGQYVYVVPNWSLVVVATSEVVDATNDNTGPILIRHVFPAVRP